jgi:hypothetical protein
MALAQGLLVYPSNSNTQPNGMEKLPTMARQVTTRDLQQKPGLLRLGHENILH